jgi:hypothetical protein
MREWLELSSQEVCKELSLTPTNLYVQLHRARLRLQECLNTGKSLSYQDWGELTQLINSIYTNFTEKLYSLYHMSEHECHVSLLTKIHLQPKDIALLTAHSKESIATTRSRLYSKVFGRKGSSKDWDDFILTL